QSLSLSVTQDYHGGMTKHTKLMGYKCFQILILIWIFVYICDGDIIISRCHEECERQVRGVKGEDLFCNKDCKLYQCNSGCDSYTTAVNSSCQAVCRK
ncbi:Hypothetical predicted protein, partial [Mytilus galloprovincialis]